MRLSLDGTAMNILVGQKETPVSVHPQVLIGSSAFFQGALKKEWLGEEPAIKLPEDETPTVQAYVTWLYTGSILCKREADTVRKTISIVLMLMTIHDMNIM